MEFMPDGIYVFNRQNVGNEKPNIYDYLNTSFSSFSSFTCATNGWFKLVCQHYARADKQNANFDHYFWHKSKVSVEVNGPLSSVKLSNKFY